MNPEREKLIERVEHDFTYFPPNNPIVQTAHKAWGEVCRDAAIYAAEHLPLGRDLSLVITLLEDVRMRGNKAIATNHEAVINGD